MIDARLSIGLPNHPKTKKLIRRLGPEGAWRLVCLILWCAQNRPDGDLSGLTTEDIELSVDWPGEPDAFVRAMSGVGFLDGSNGNYRLHDWEEHNPWAAGSEARSEKARWLALCKHHGRKKAAEMMPDYAERLKITPEGDASSTNNAASSIEKPQNSSAPSPSPSPSPKSTPISPSGDMSGEKAPPDVAALPLTLDCPGLIALPSEAQAEKPPRTRAPPDRVNGHRREAVEVLDFLNAKAHRSYRPVDSNLKMIACRLKEGATVGECRAVIAKKCREWGTDEKMAQYLRPATLFNATKFAQYVGELVAQND